MPLPLAHLQHLANPFLITIAPLPCLDQAGGGGGGDAAAAAPAAPAAAPAFTEEQSELLWRSVSRALLRLGKGGATETHAR